MKRRAFLIAVTAIAAVGVAGSKPADAQDKTITVFAAASMKNALDDINAAYTKKTGVKVVASYAASSALVKQIEQGAPADVFVSADLDWMDYAVAEEAHQGRHPRQPARQQLVLIAPKDSKIDNVTIGPGFDLAKLAGDGRIATGDVQAVPVGKYAKAALEKLGAWSAAEPKFAMAENVRAALTLVARGEAALGIVYETDAKVEPSVKIVGAFPPNSHPADRLSGRARPRPRSRRPRDYLAFLRSHGGEDHVREIRLHVPGRQPSSRSANACDVFDLTPDEWTAIQLSLRIAIVATRGGAAVRHRGRLAAGAQAISGARRCSTASCICRWCCRRSSPAICC